jgi:hypothetical protein
METSHSAQKLLETFGNHRVRYLRHIEFRPPFPALRYGKQERKQNLDISCRENADELRKKDEIFTRQIRIPFTTIEILEINTKEYGPGRIQLTIYNPMTLIDEAHCLHRHQVSWRVHLLSPEKLPNLYSIRALNIEAGSAIHWLASPTASIAKIDLRIIPDLASKLRSPEYLGCRLGYYEWTPDSASEFVTQYFHDAEGPRRDSRHDFLKAINDLPDSLRNVQLDFFWPLTHVDAIDQRGTLPNLVFPSLHGDPFSSSLRILSY